MDTWVEDKSALTKKCIYAGNFKYHSIYMYIWDQI
jgi:hypothetical protein